MDNNPTQTKLEDRPREAAPIDEPQVTTDPPPAEPEPAPDFEKALEEAGLEQVRQDGPWTFRMEPGLTFGAIRVSNPFDKLAAALAKAQLEILAAPRTSEGEVPGRRVHHYSDLAAVREAFREPFARQGLAWLQGSALAGLESLQVSKKNAQGRWETIEQTGARVATTSLILHESGQWAVTSIELLAEDCFPHAVGSAITYGRRYSGAPLVGVVSEPDDDGRAAMGERPEGSSAARAARNGQATTNGDGVLVIDWGRNKGTPVTELDKEDLAYHRDRTRARLDSADFQPGGDKERFRAEEEDKLQKLLAEVKRRQDLANGAAEKEATE